MAGRPLLLLVAGPPGSGKTTLSRLVGDAVGLPVVCRDAIKEGVAHTTGDVVRAGTPEAARLFDLFHDVVDGMLAAGISVVAEAAFRGDLARPQLLARTDVARVRLVRCVTTPERWFARFQARGARPGHRDAEFVERITAAGGPSSATARYHLELPGVPTLDIDTTDGYAPGLDAIIAFATSP